MSTPRQPSNADQSTIVALIGHCSPDSWMLKSVVERAIPGARIERVNDQTGLEEAARTADVLLVNRVLDGTFSSDSGIGLIASLREAPTRRAELLLISNLPDAQAQAEEAGALPGFGKANAGSAIAAERLAAAVAKAKGSRR